MKTSDFNYELPKELIAQHPLEKRDMSRLMVLHRDNRTIEHKQFKDIIEYLEKGDCLVINDTKVIPARLFAIKDTGAKVEIFIVRETEKDVWIALIKPSKRVKPKMILKAGEKLSVEIIEKIDDKWKIRYGKQW